MNIFEKIYGTIFMGLIATGLFVATYLIWSDNPTFALIIGFFGLICALYAIGLFLLPLIHSIKNRKK